MKVIYSFLIIIFLITVSLFSLVGANKPIIENIIDEELNFKFNAPAGFYNMDLKNINPDIKYSFVSIFPTASLFIIPEDIGISDEFNIKNYAELIKDNMKKVSKEFTINKEGELKIKDYNGYYIDVNTTLLNYNYDFHYIIWFYYKNGFVYQFGYFVTKSLSNDESENVFTNAVNAFSNFSILDMNKKSSKKFTLEILNTFKDSKFYKSDELKYTLDLNKSLWKINIFTTDDNMDTDVNGVYEKDDTFFCIHSFIAGYDDANIDFISAVFLEYFNINFKNDHFIMKKKIDENNLKGYTLNFKRTTDNKEFFYKFKIIIKKDRSFLLSAYTDKNDKPYLEKIFDELDKNFKISEASNKIDIKKLNNQERKNQSTSFNRLGINYYYNDINKALFFFQKAFELDNSDPAILSNILTSYYNLRKYNEGLKFLSMTDCDYKDSNNTIKAEKARLLFSLGMNEDSYNIYKTIFSEEYSDDVFFLNFLDLLIQLNKNEKADSYYNNYKEKKTELIIEYSKLYFNLKNYEKAIKILDDYDKNNYLNPDVSYWLITNYNQSEQYKKSLDICDKLINSGYDNFDTYYFKGETEYYLKWYKESKISLEKALSFSPNNQEVNELLNLVSSFLGEGYNSVIKNEIKPVIIPSNIINSALAAKTNEDLSKYNSYYTSYIKGYSYIKNKELKLTSYTTIKINDMSGVSKYSTIEIPYDPLSEKVYINSIIIKNEKNITVSKCDPKDYYIVDKQNSEFANYDKVINAPIPNLQPGFSIEITVTYQYGSTDNFYFKREYLSRDEICIYSALFITGNIEEIIYKNINCEQPIKLNNILIWSVANPNFFKNEAYSTFMENYLSIVLLSNKNNIWKNIVDEYLKTINDKLIIEKEISELSKKLTNDLQSNNEKILQILSYVQENIIYKAIEFGTRSKIPNNGSLILKNKYGDCKDQALLSYLLLKAAGINSTLALMNSYEVVDENMPSLDQFNHMILYIPEFINKLIDVTLKEINPSFVVFYYLNRKILLLDTENFKIVNYNNEIDINNCKISIEKKLTVSDSLNVEEKINISNYYSLYLRYLLKNINKNDYFNEIQSILSNINKNAVLIKFDVKNLNNLNSNLFLEISYKIDTDIKHDNDIIINVPVIFERFFLNPISIVDKKTPFETLIPLDMVSNNIIITPVEYKNKLKSDTKTTEIKKFGFWKYDLKQSNEGYIINYEFNLKKGYFNKSEYQEFYNFLNDSLKFLSKNTIIKN